jgi:hypothetical protein
MVVGLAVAVPGWGLIAILAAIVVAAAAYPVLRVAAVWFLVGFWFYAIPEFYHQAYLLEALTGLALLSAQCWQLVVRQAAGEFERAPVGLRRRLGRAAVWAAAAVAVLLIAASVWMRPVSRLASASEALTAFDQSNGATSRAVEGIVREAPTASVLLMLSNEQRQATAEQWRGESLSYRASQVRVLDNPDLEAMIGALGRRDVTVEEFGPPGTVQDRSRPVLGLAFSAQERADFERNWRVDRVIDFSVGRSMIQLLWLQLP